MICPRCKSDQVIVVDSRPRAETTWRRRECYACKNRFNTCEIEEEAYKAFTKILDIIQGRKDEEEYC